MLLLIVRGKERPQYKTVNKSHEDNRIFHARIVLRFTKEEFRSVASTESVNSQSFLPDHHLSFFVRHSSQEPCVFPADTKAGPLPPKYLHESQESVQNVDSQNKRFSWKPKEVGQTPKIFHLHIPLSRTQSVFILRQEKQSQNSPVAAVAAVTTHSLSDLLLMSKGNNFFPKYFLSLTSKKKNQ